MLKPLGKGHYILIYNYDNFNIIFTLLSVIAAASWTHPRRRSNFVSILYHEFSVGGRGEEGQRSIVDKHVRPEQFNFVFFEHLGQKLKIGRGKK